MLSLLELGNGPAVIRYIVRRLRRILPKGTAIVVCLWSEGEAPTSLKAVLETGRADAYATSLPEAVELCIAFAKGEHAKNDEMPSVESARDPSDCDCACSRDPRGPLAGDCAARAGDGSRAAQEQQEAPATPRKPQTASA